MKNKLHNLAIIIYRRLEFLQPIYRAIRRPLARRQAKRNIQHVVENDTPLKVVIGADQKPRGDWILTEIYTLDILSLDDWAFYFSEESISALLAEHVWEHLTQTEGLIAAKNCYHYLKPGGYLRVAVPDGLFPSPEYIEFVRPDGSGPSAWDHKVLYDYQSLEKVFTNAGFTVTLLEYWDENGHFHEEAWQAEDGIVLRARRSAKRYFPSNNNEQVGYTSIILDAHK